MGAWRNAVPIRVSATDDPARASVDIGYSRRTGIDDFARIMTRLLERGINVTQGGSAALGLARVADGRLDGYAERHLYAWDALAGLLLVEEAGGRVNAFLDGGGLTSGNETMAADARALRGDRERARGALSAGHAIRALAKQLRHVLAGEAARDQHEQQRHHRRDRADGARLRELVAQHELVDRDRDRLPLRRIEQHGGADLADQRREHEDRAGEDRRRGERHHHAAHRRRPSRRRRSSTRPRALGSICAIAAATERKTNATRRVK